MFQSFNVARLEKLAALMNLAAWTAGGGRPHVCVSCLRDSGFMAELSQAYALG